MSVSPTDGTGPTQGQRKTLTRVPVFVREEIVDLYNNGVGVSEISRNTRVTKGAVHKVVQHFALHGTMQPFSCGGSEPIFGIFGVDYFNTIPGPSNGQELLNFFHGVLDMQRDNGVRIILPGDAVIMDSCGFYHGRITERLLRNMLESRGAQLIFQPPYLPHLNPCELCFREMKINLRRNDQYSTHQTEMAINDSVNKISPLHSLRYFRHCGYF